VAQARELHNTHMSVLHKGNQCALKPPSDDPKIMKNKVADDVMQIAERAGITKDTVMEEIKKVGCQ
jgi:hypothetical protein